MSLTAPPPSDEPAQAIADLDDARRRVEDIRVLVADGKVGADVRAARLVVNVNQEVAP